MAERPDLDTAHNIFITEASHWPEHIYRKVSAVFTYCRELEAENKRLGKRCVELAREFEIDLVKRMSE